MRSRLSTTLALVAPMLGMARAELDSKHGLALIGDLSNSDIRLLTAKNSPISWYYTWSPWPSTQVGDSTVFLPLLPGLDTLEEDDIWDVLDDLPSSSTHLLSFNEPDEEDQNGGNEMSPEDAAEAYIEYIVPLRDGEGPTSSGRTWNISHPVVSGSERGLEWLRDFNESCYEIDEDNGCPTDFVSVHWYGDAAGLDNWLNSLRDFYNPNNETDIAFWITEMAVPGEDDETNRAMMNQSMAHLDELDDVAGYAWFGAFRPDDANDWTGDGPSLLDDEGSLSDLGEEYLGGETGDFDVDEDRGDDEDDGSAGMHVQIPSLILALGLGLCLTWAW